MKNSFFDKKVVIGMVHLLPLPGNAAYRGNKEEIKEKAIADAHTLLEGGVDAIMLENFSDWPQYSTEIPLEAYSVMLNIATEIKSFCTVPFGVNIEMNAYKQEWAMAYGTSPPKHCCSPMFIRRRPMAVPRWLLTSWPKTP